MVQEGPESPTHRPKTPKMAPRRPKRPPGSPKRPQRGPTNPPRGPQVAPRGPQEAKKRPQNGPQEPSKLPPRGLQEAPPQDPNGHLRTHRFFESRPAAETSRASEGEASFLGPRVAPASDTSLLSSCFSLVLARALPSSRHSHALLLLLSLLQLILFPHPSSLASSHLHPHASFSS